MKRQLFRRLVLAMYACIGALLVLHPWSGVVCPTHILHFIHGPLLLFNTHGRADKQLGAVLTASAFSCVCAAFVLPRWGRLAFAALGVVVWIGSAIAIARWCV